MDYITPKLRMYFKSDTSDKDGIWLADREILASSTNDTEITPRYKVILTDKCTKGVHKEYLNG